MASTKLISSSASRNSDRRKSSAASSSSSSTMPPYPHDLQQYNNNNNNNTSMNYNNNNNLEATSRIFQNNNNTSSNSTLLNAEITLLDAAGAITPISDSETVPVPVRKKTVDDVWREIVEGKKEQFRVCKEEAKDEIMTLEEFLVKAGAVEEEVVAGGVVEQGPVKVELGTERLSGGIFGLDSASPYMVPTPQQSVEGFGNGMDVIGGGGRGKRKVVLEPLDKAAMQRQRRMIKNRESAARSRERKQAYQVELESMAVKLEEEKEQLLKEKDERTRVHYKLLIEKVIPVVEKRRPPPALRRVRSMQW